MQTTIGEDIELDLEGMRYYYRAYPIGTLQIGDRQLPDFTPPDAGRELARACPRAAFTTIHEADHFSYLEHPRTVMDLALNFFRELPLDGVPGCAPVEYFGHDLPDRLQEVA